MKSLILFSLLCCQLVLIIPARSLSAIPTKLSDPDLSGEAKFVVGMSIPPAFGGTKLVDNSWSDANNDCTLAGVESADSSGEAYCLKVQPNPQNSSIIITFLIDSETSVQLGLYNIIGQQVERWEATTFEAGHHRMEITHLQLRSGLYFVSFQTISCRVIRKVLYVH